MFFKNKIRQIAVCLLLVLLWACSSTRELVVLHTNDTHSQVEANRESKEVYGGKGGYARRAAFIAEVRAKNQCVLLVDAGDFCQGTPYFNFFRGEVEAKALSAMHYDAVTLGNHEFDNGVDALANVLSQMQVPVVCSNYDVKGTPLENKVQPFLILNKDGLKIGIIGLGINPKGLVADQNFKGVIYLDPVERANYYAQRLKKTEHCDFVLCLSHLGDTGVEVSDRIVAAKSAYIDMIVGGHTHKLIQGLKVANAVGDSVPIVQAGKTGAYIGQIHIKFKKAK